MFHRTISDLTMGSAEGGLVTTRPVRGPEAGVAWPASNRNALIRTAGMFCATGRRSQRVTVSNDEVNEAYDHKSRGRRNMLPYSRRVCDRKPVSKSAVTQMCESRSQHQLLGCYIATDKYP